MKSKRVSASRKAKLKRSFDKVKTSFCVAKNYCHCICFNQSLWLKWWAGMPALRRFCIFIHLPRHSKPSIKCQKQLTLIFVLFTLQAGSSTHRNGRIYFQAALFHFTGNKSDFSIHTQTASHVLCFFFTHKLPISVDFCLLILKFFLASVAKVIQLVSAKNLFKINNLSIYIYIYIMQYATF